jgi:spore coat protein CotH
MKPLMLARSALVFVVWFVTACGSNPKDSIDSNTGGATSSGDRGGNGSTAVGGSTATNPNVMNGRFAVPTMTIQVTSGADITSKEEFVPCNVTIDGKGSFADYSAEASIRGRGNSTWLWYDKKPYRLKLNEKSEILGLAADKDWVLLANYRDPTFLMNAFAFEMADFMGIPYTNHSRFVEVTLNGQYMGLYQLTEQVEQGKNRVDVVDNGGLLLSLDEDDGPAILPNAADNFTSSEYQLPVAVKYPKNLTAEQLLTIKDDFAKLERAIASADYDAVAQLLDIPSLINFLSLQELTYNVELVTPRSMYLHKNPNSVYVMGPVWDFDGGFDFDWSTMMTGHNYFLAQDLVMGSDPARTNTVSSFWVNLFKNARFVSEYKNRWNSLNGTALLHCWDVLDNWVVSLSEALARNAQRWPTDKDYKTEIIRMKQWLQTRETKLNTVVNAYPAN